jgi:hypothetical protein
LNPPFPVSILSPPISFFFPAPSPFFFLSKDDIKKEPALVNTDQTGNVNDGELAEQANNFDHNGSQLTTLKKCYSCGLSTVFCKNIFVKSRHVKPSVVDLESGRIRTIFEGSELLDIKI